MFLLLIIIYLFFLLFSAGWRKFCTGFYTVETQRKGQEFIWVLWGSSPFLSQVCCFVMITKWFSLSSLVHTPCKVGSTLPLPLSRACCFRQLLLRNMAFILPMIKSSWRSSCRISSDWARQSEFFQRQVVSGTCYYGPWVGLWSLWF